jgi:phosphoadenosine phosphosulfate reductase
LLKTAPINKTITDRNIQALFTGIRWDEHGARENESYFSEREIPPHTRVHPILHFSERDIWNINFALDIPYNDLYERGYRSIGTKSGTVKSSNMPAWEQDLENTSERLGRSKEKEKMMEQLRVWGYI